MGRHNKSRRHEGERRHNHGRTRADTDHYGYGQAGYDNAPMQYYGQADYYPPTQYSDYSRPPIDYDYQQSYMSYEPPLQHNSQPPAPYGEVPPTEQNYEQARQRNFDIWAKWRGNMNDSILADFDGGEVRPMPPLEAALQGDDNAASLYDPNILMNYSLATNSATDLESDSFLKFGIPRAKFNTKNPEYRSLFSADGERHVRMQTENGKQNMYIVRTQSRDGQPTSGRPMSPIY